ncbi:YncE family protein [Bradyrhizobium sp.]|uniref:YncE family protein n=1 Tax=Bradyrhizobium sp. TaxID=376 RepID=UPI0025BF2734|nr:hypothetical protein [Bradyrhizobium sp.]MBV8920715.1 hypothetical protein [Bradyrhizobium sp.]
MVRVYVTNSAGDCIDVIDPAANKVVQQIKGVEGAHGIAFSPDASRVYVSDEVDSTLDVFERKSGRLVKKVPLSAHPNNIAAGSLAPAEQRALWGFDPGADLGGERHAGGMGPSDGRTGDAASARRACERGLGVR